MKYEQDDGEWFKLGKGFRLACCSCDLVHDVEARIKDGVVWIRLVRNERATVRRRHSRKKHVIIVDE